MDFDNSSRIDPKRGHQWLMDATEPEVFSNKKQAIEAVNSRTVSGISPMNVSPWHNTSSFQSVSADLFGSEPARTANLVDRNFPSVDGGSLNMGRNHFQDHYNNISMGLSMSHFVQDPSCLNLGGIKKVGINQGGDSGNDVSASTGHSNSRGDNSSISTGSTSSDNSVIFLGSNNNNLGENTISTGHNFSKADISFIPMSHTLNKGQENFISMGYTFSKRNENVLSMGKSFDKGDNNFMSIGQSSEKGNSNVISMGSSYHNTDDNFNSMGHTFDKGNESFISMCSTYDKGGDNNIAITPTFEKADSNISFVCTTQDKGDSGVLSMGHNYNKGNTNTICFGGFQDETVTNHPIISSYDLLMATQNSDHASEEPCQKDLVVSSVDSVVTSTLETNSRTDTVPKNKERKTARKVPANNFPSNVKSLLSTGILDGVPVKYVSWSREKSVKGTIRGTGYLCGCNDCKFTKAVSAYDLERHANCNTKHPNNHIYFANGKTIYAIVQELKNTPQEELFDAMQNVTGSQINQKNFRTWKASYEAASRELQRIYGKEEIVIPSLK